MNCSNFKELSCDELAYTTCKLMANVRSSIRA